MKRHLIFTNLALSLMLIAGLSLAGSDKKHMSKRHPTSEQFNKMKTLAGVWKGTMDMHGEEKEITVEYQVTAGESAVVETHFPGTPHEMVSIYHDGPKGKLMMTHYCMLGNQPRMKMTSSNDKEFKFSLAKRSGLRSKKDPHMHKLNLTFASNDKIVQEWTMFENGKAGHTSSFELNRIIK